MNELLQAIKKGKVSKVPGREGICLEFFKETWEFTKQYFLVIVNNMYTYIDGQITDQQKHDILLCIPNNSDPERIWDYRPLTLLNSDYKLLTRIIANRMGPWMTNITQWSQHCGPHGNTIFDAAAAIRDVVAYAEISGPPLCVLSIDFKDAFHKISHNYLFELLRIYGFSERFQQRIKGVYDRVTSSIQINGHRSHPTPITISVRQGCPLSILLFALCLNPLIRTLEQNLTGIQIGSQP